MSDNNINWDEDDNDGNASSVPPPPSFDSTAPPSFPVFPSQNTEVAPVESLNSTNGDIVTVEAAGEGEHVTVVQVDANGNEVVTVVDLALPPLEYDEAREITEKIKGTTNLLYLLIKRAHAGKAYLALGYSSFEKYVREEFDYSRSYAYKLLNQANVIEAIEAVVPEGTEVHVGELAARSLKQSLPELVEVIEEQTSGRTPDEASQILNDVIREAQERQKAEREFEGDYDTDDDSSFNDPGFNDDFSFDGPGPAGGMDFLDDDDSDEELDQFLSDEDPFATVRRFEALWNLLQSLRTLAGLSETTDLDEIIPIIPDDQTDEVTTSIDQTLAWLNILKERWQDRLQQGPSENNGEENPEGFNDDVFDEGNNDEF